MLQGCCKYRVDVTVKDVQDICKDSAVDCSNCVFSAICNMPVQKLLLDACIKMLLHVTKNGVSPEGNNSPMWQGEYHAPRHSITMLHNVKASWEAAHHHSPNVEAYFSSGYAIQGILHDLNL